MVIKERDGYEFLESEIELYNMLVRRQHEEDEILSLFNIQLIDDDYKNRDNLDVNNIYVVRGDTDWNQTPITFEGEVFKTTVYIVINVSNYDIVRASALLKSAVKCISQYIEFEALAPYTHIRKIQPRYADPGRLHEYTIELECTEIDRLGFYSDFSRDIKLYLSINAKVEGEKEFKRLFPPTQIKSELLPLVEYEYDDNEFAGG